MLVYFDKKTVAIMLKYNTLAMLSIGIFLDYISKNSFIQHYIILFIDIYIYTTEDYMLRIKQKSCTALETQK